MAELPKEGFVSTTCSPRPPAARAETWPNDLSCIPVNWAGIGRKLFEPSCEAICRSATRYRRASSSTRPGESVVIADTFACPVFETAGGVRFFPCEAVVAVGQVKSSMTSESVVRAALENVESVSV